MTYSLTWYEEGISYLHPAIAFVYSQSIYAMMSDPENKQSAVNKYVNFF